MEDIKELTKYDQEPRYIQEMVLEPLSRQDSVRMMF